MKDTYSRGYKAAALVLLLIELAVLPSSVIQFLL